MDTTSMQRETRASKERLENRETLYDLFANCPIPADQLLVNLGLFMRSSAVTKLLYINELYQEILRIPGSILEFGVWWGQNLVLFENLRAVYEPFNHYRRVIGFDTFEGYAGFSEKDAAGALIREQGHSVGSDYLEYLDRLLEYHERENVLFREKRSRLVKGLAQESLEVYLAEHPETVVSLAYFDMALYEPTKRCLELLKPHLVQGSIITLDELNSEDCPGETQAAREALGLDCCKIRQSRFMPGRSYLVWKE